MTTLLNLIEKRIEDARVLEAAGDRPTMKEVLDELVEVQAILNGELSELQSDLECPEMLSEAMAKEHEKNGDMPSNVFALAASELTGRKVDEYEGALSIDSLGGQILEFKMSAGSTPEQVKLELKRLALEWCAEHMATRLLSCNGVESDGGQ